MKKPRFLALLLIFAISLSNMTALCSADGDDSWPFCRHDSQNTGFYEGLAPSSNNTLWTVNMSTVFISSLGLGGYPVFSNGKLFTIGNGSLFAFNATDGKIIWQTEISGGLTGLAVAYGMVFVGAFTELVAVDENSGAEIYRVKLTYVLELQAINVADGKLFISSHDDYTYCVNASNGEVLWKTLTYRFGSHAPPAVSDGLVFQAASTGVYCLNESDGSIVWHYNQGYCSTPSVAGGKVFFIKETEEANVNSSIMCLNQQTGQVEWEYPTRVSSNHINQGPSYSLTAIAYEKVFAVVNGMLYALDENTGELIWVSDGLGKPLSDIPPVVAEHRVFVADHDYILGLDVDNGTVVWRYALSGARNPHIVANGILYSMNAESLIAVPEFPSTTAIIVLLALTLIASIVYKRKQRPSFRSH
jgi:outer membrane protein assembly factor BamB